MNISQVGLNLVEYFEGLYLDAYWDATGQVWTIGYGHTGADVYQGLTITEQQANELLRLDMIASDNEVNGAVTVPLTQGQFDALSSFVFNGGLGMLQGTMLDLLNSGDYVGCSSHFTDYVYSGGVYLEGLYNRRVAEQHLFDTGEFNGNVATGGSGGGTTTQYYKLLYPYTYNTFKRIPFNQNKFELIKTTGNVCLIQNFMSKRKYYVYKRSLKTI